MQFDALIASFLISSHLTLLFLFPSHGVSGAAHRASVVESFDKYYTHLVATSAATRPQGDFFNETHLIDAMTGKPESVNIEAERVRVRAKKVQTT